MIVGSEAHMNGEVEQLFDPDGIYPMRIVTRMTGLTADTVRVWERRYGAVRPDRTDGNARRYTDREVKRLILLREATSRGHAIGEIANLDEPELVKLVRGEEQLAVQTRTYDTLVEEIIRHVEAFEPRRVHEVFVRAAATLPPRELVYGLVVPLLQRVGDRWERGETTVIHEHVISGHVKGLLGTFMRLVQVPEGAPRILCGSPEGHIHEFGALLASLIALTRGVEAVFIGPDVPFAEIPAAAKRARASLVVLSFMRSTNEEELVTLEEGVKKVAAVTDVWLGCPDGHEATKRNMPARFFHDFESFDTALVSRFSTPSMSVTG